METPEYFHSQFAAENRHSSDNDMAGGGGGEHFIVEELLDFSNDDTVIADGTIFNSFNGNSTESSAVTVIESCNSSSFSSCEPNSFFDGGNLASDGQFSGELCVPYDDLAELEWLSNFAEESFSSEDLQKLELISGMKLNPNDSSKTPLTTTTTTTDNRTRNLDNIVSASVSVSVSIPAKAARSKRSRTIPSNWNNSPLLPLSPTTSSSETDIVVFRPPMKKKDFSDVVGDGRKCLHCATDKTPQWRTGPMGPKTLCNACGVRYKSGRLVPEYRPAASPTFVVTKHSNSHRKVMELRRQKEVTRGEKQERMLIEYGEEMMKDDESDDYLIHQHMGPHFPHLI